MPASASYSFARVSMTVLSMDLCPLQMLNGNGDKDCYKFFHFFSLHEKEATCIITAQKAPISLMTVSV